MFTKLSEPHTYVLAYVAILAVAFIVWRIIDAINRRGERFNERFITFRETEHGEPATLSTDVIPSVGIVERHANDIRTAIPTLPTNRPAPFPTRPIRDNPQG